MAVAGDRLGLGLLVKFGVRTSAKYSRSSLIEGSVRRERRVTAALALLSPLERAAFALRHYEGRTIDEISATLGLGTSAAKQAIFRAVRKLRAELQELRIET